MNRNELNQQFRQLLESTVIPQEALETPEFKNKLSILREFVKKNVPQRLFRFRSAKNIHSILSFEHNTITLCSADVFTDRFDSVVYVNKEKIREDIVRGFDWNFQKTVIEEILQTGNFPQEWIQLYGRENATMIAEIYKAVPKDVLKMAGEEGKKQYLAALLENISPLADALVWTIRHDKETKIACFTEDIHSSYMWDNYADGYSGFALEYDMTGELIGKKTECKAEQTYPELYPVIYSDNKYDASDIAVWILGKTFYQINGLAPMPCPDMLFKYKALLYKDAIGYSHEKEWRFMCTCAYARESQFMEIESGTRMKAIYYGPYMEKTIKEHLRGWALRHGIKEYDVKLDDKSSGYDLVIEPM